jgi:CDP-4-dehydro-6-deoxyglucose reductase, E1
MITKQQIIDQLNSYILFKPSFVAGETYIPVTAKTVDEQDILHVMQAGLDGWFTEGDWTKLFMKELKRAYTPNMRYVIPTTSGSSANLLAITTICQPEFQSKALKPGDEVITPAVGFPTTVSGIIQNNLVPVFVDVCLPTYNASADSIEAAITENTKAVVMPHTLGNPFELERLRALCDEEGLWLLGDGCDALGSEIDGVWAGSLEDISTLSFYPAHHITTGEGGAVLTNSPMIAKVVESLRSWGRGCWCEPGRDNTCGKRFSHTYEDLPFGYDHKYVYQRLGYNLKITDMQGALGYSQLQKLPDFIAARRHNWQRLYDGMKKWEKYFVLPQATKNSKPSWFGFCLTLQKGTPFQRLELVSYLEENKIGTRLLFAGNLTRHPAFKGVEYRTAETLYNADVITSHTFWIGVHPSMTDEMIDYILERFDSFIKQKGLK